MNQKAKRIPFTDSENYTIRYCVKILGENWDLISQKLPGRTPKQIHDRWVNYLRDGLIKAPWTNKEDGILIDLYNKIGPKWTKMMINLPGRSGNDIKNRWHKHLCKKVLPPIEETNSDESLISDNIIKNNPQYIQSNINIDIDLSSIKNSLEIQEIIDESKILDLDFQWI